MKKTAVFMSKALLLSGVNILVRFVSVKFNAYIALKVGTECMGLFTLVSSVYGLSVTAACAGIGIAVVKAVSETYALIEKNGDTNPSARLKKIALCSVLYSLAFGIVSGGAVFVFSKQIGCILLGDERTVTSLRAFALSLPFVSSCAALSGYFTGVGKIYKNAVLTVTEQIIKIVVISSCLMVAVPNGIEWSCLAIVGGTSLSEALSLIGSVILFVTDKSGSKFAGKTKIPEVNELRRVSLLALPIGVGAFARQGLITAEHIAIPRQLEKYGLGKSAALSAYGIMQGMVMPLVLFPSAVVYAFSGLLIPELSGCAVLGEEKRVKRIGEKVIRSSVLFSVAVAGIFIFFSKEIGLGFYNSSEAARQLGLVGALVPVMYLDSAVDGMLKGLGEQIYCMRVNLIDSSLCLILVFVLVPHFGIDGYIALMMISECVNFFLSAMRLLKVTKIKVMVVKWIAVPIMSAVGAYFILKLPSEAFDTVIPFPVKIVSFIIIYLVLCVLLGALEPFNSAIFKKENTVKTTKVKTAV